MNTEDSRKQARTIATPPCGAVQGEDRDGVLVFRGIPYGDDVDGEWRFLPPRPAKPWKEIRDATRNGPVAVQPGEGGSISGSEGLGPYFSGGEPEKFGVFDEKQSENCLVLNVITPAADGRRRPVLVYLHGGGFTTGSGTLAIGADRFVREQDEVLVSVNHRLNVFGFLYLGEFDGKYAKSGIAGVLDLVLALKWVQTNIAAFGGDPENVTIMGESGGGAKVSMLLSMECAQGLFHKAIVESGSTPSFTTSKERGTELARKVLEMLDIPENDLAALSRKTTEEIKAVLDGELGQLTGLSPVADGEVAMYNPDGKYLPYDGSRDIPLMVGSSEDELAIFFAPGKRDGEFIVNEDNLRQSLLTSPALALWPVKGAHLDEENVDAAIAAATADNPKGDNADHLAMKIESACSDLGGGAFNQALERTQQGGAPVYRYFVTYDSPHPMIPGARYAWHTADLPLQLRIVLHKDAEDFSKKLSGLIGSFVRTGKPEYPDLDWPPFSAEKRETLVLDEPSQILCDPDKELRRALGEEY